MHLVFKTAPRRCDGELFVAAVRPDVKVVVTRVLQQGGRLKVAETDTDIQQYIHTHREREENG